MRNTSLATTSPTAPLTEVCQQRKSEEPQGHWNSIEITSVTAPWSCTNNCPCTIAAGDRSSREEGSAVSGSGRAIGVPKSTLSHKALRLHLLEPGSLRRNNNACKLMETFPCKALHQGFTPLSARSVQAPPSAYTIILRTSRTAPFPLHVRNVAAILC